jgi:hypothetical protein
MACLLTSFKWKNSAPAVRDALVENVLGLLPLRFQLDQIGHDELPGAVCERRAQFPAHFLEVIPDLARNPLRQNKLRRLALRGGFCFCLRLWYWLWLR